MLVSKKPYAGHYPSAARYLIESGVCATPRQYEREFKYYDGLDIVYTLHNMTPANFRSYADTFLLLAFQEATRYKEYKWKFAKFDVRLGKLKKGKDLPDITTFQSAMHPDPDIMVYGPGYEVPQRHFLKDKVEDILDIAKRYPTKISTQRPYKVLKLTICIRTDKK